MEENQYSGNFPARNSVNLRKYFWECNHNDSKSAGETETLILKVIYFKM